MKFILLLLGLVPRGSATDVHRSLRTTALAAPDAEQALRRMEAVEDTRTSHVLCKVAGADGSSVTVRLQAANNARSLVFNDDVDGVETKIRCVGAPDPQCLVASAGVVNSADQCPQCPCRGNAGELFGQYARAMAQEVDAKCGKGGITSDGMDSPFRVLLLGLGAGEMAAHISKSCGGAEIEGVELNERLPVLANLYFGMPSSVKTTVGDAGLVVVGLAQQVTSNQLLAEQKQYDQILVDCFSTGGVTPEHCRSEDFVVKLHTLLRNGGRVLHHMWDVDDKHPQVPTDFTNTIALYRKIFNCKGCGVQVQKLEGGPDSLIIATYPEAAKSFLQVAAVPKAVPVQQGGKPTSAGGVPVKR